MHLTVESIFWSVVFGGVVVRRVRSIVVCVGVGCGGFLGGVLCYGYSGVVVGGGSCDPHHCSIFYHDFICNSSDVVSQQWLLKCVEG